MSLLPRAQVYHGLLPLHSLCPSLTDSSALQLIHGKLLNRSRDGQSGERESACGSGPVRAQDCMAA